jgi:hypothetical protein
MTPSKRLHCAVLLLVVSITTSAFGNGSPRSANHKASGSTQITESELLGAYAKTGLLGPGTLAAMAGDMDASTTPGEARGATWS